MTSKGKILKLALPAMVENILQMLMGVVDNYLVAQIGLAAVSGVAVANNIITIYQAIFIALGSAVSSLIAKSRGEQNAQKTLTYAADSLLVTAFIGFLLGMASILFGSRLLDILGTEPAVSQMGGVYFAIVGGGIISLALMTSLGSILRAQGKMQLPMYISLITNALNAALSALSIFVFHWGIAGVALATVLSRLIGVFLLASQLPMPSILKVTRPRVTADLMKLALPAAAERLMMRAGDVVIVAIIVKLGTEVVAGNAIGETLSQFNYMPGMGVATAAVILVAHNVGSGNDKYVHQIVKDSYLLSTCLMLLVGAIVYIFGGSLTHLFTGNAGAIRASQVVLLFSFLGGPVTAGTLIYTATWQGLGDAKLPFYATTFGMWFIRIILAYILGITLKLGLSGVWLATVADNIFRFSFLYHRYKNHMKAH